MNQAHSAENLTNARSHDLWKTIGFSIASVGLFAVTWFGPPLAPLTAAGAVGAGTTAFGSGLATQHGDSNKKIKDYQSSLLSYAKVVEHDMKATQKMMDFFQQAEQMLTEERPFDKDRWQDMIKYLRTTHLFNDT